MFAANRFTSANMQQSLTWWCSTTGYDERDELDVYQREFQVFRAAVKRLSANVIDEKVRQITSLAMTKKWRNGKTRFYFESK